MTPLSEAGRVLLKAPELRLDRTHYVWQIDIGKQQQQ